MNRFAPRYSDQELLAIVAAVATHACPEEPLKLTQAGFNAAREEAGYRTVKRADHIVEQIGSPWPEILRLALEDNDSTQTLGARRRHHHTSPLTPAKISHALRRIAELLDSDNLSEHAYGIERDRLVEEDADRWLHGGTLADLLPTAAAIVGAVGSWEQAIIIAGLPPQRSEKLPVYPLESALNDFIINYGFAPTSRMLHDYQAARGMACPDRPKHNYGGSYEAWLRGQLAQGENDDIAVLKDRRGAPKDWEQINVLPAPPGYLMREESARRPWSLADCEDAMRKALDLVGSAQLTKKLYIRLAQAHTLVSVNGMTSALERDEPGLTWVAFRDRIIAQRAQEDRPRSRRKSRTPKKG
jgi:hypothetical protein